MRDEALTEIRRVEAMVLGIATRSVRRELFGLMLIGAGTIAGVLPSLPW